MTSIHDRWAAYKRAQTAGSGTSGAVVRRFPFAFNSPNILTGHTIYTPTAGDVLIDSWVEVVTAWNGTTPSFGGAFNGDSDPYGNISTVDLTVVFASASSLSSISTRHGLAANPALMWITQDGSRTGADPGSTQGAAVLYLVTATPA